MSGFSSFVDSGLGVGDTSGIRLGKLGDWSSSKVGTSPSESMERDNRRTDRTILAKTITVLYRRCK
jgi:hypothetical protein